MLFREAFKMMKNGMKVKLPSWGGYWYWSEEKQTIIMHTKDGDEMDIRETQVPDYTFSNIASDDWVLADEQNCPELGGVNTFSFGEAIKYLKRGMKVARKGWNGKRMYIRYVDLYTDKAYRVTEHEPIDGTLLPYIAMKTADNGFVPWIASQADMIAEDWVFVEEE